jgi:PAS domain S-box-containing protein
MAKAQILVAEGDPVFAGKLAANLEYLGYAVTEVVSSPEGALKKAAETRPDLVLLDLGLIRNGKKDQVLGQLRQLYPQGLLYLVADEDRRALKQAGITQSFHYLRKAYDPRELETIIDMALHRRRFYEEMEASIQHRTQELSQANAALQNEMAERLWSEKKLKESEERYRLLVDLSPDAIAVYCQERLVFINPAAAQLFGATDLQEIAEKPALDLVHPEYRDAVNNRLRRLVAEGGRTKLQEIKILRPDGRAVEVEAAGVGIAYQGQAAVQVVLRDITARKRAARELEHQASFPRLNPNPVLEADLAGNIVYANAASLDALKKLGLENRTRAFLPPDLKEMLRTAAATGEAEFQREVDLGGAVFAESITFPQEFGTIRIYARDITLQKRAEMERQESLAKLQASEEELQASVEELQVQTEELQTQAEELQTAYLNLNDAYTAVDLSNRRLELLAETAGRLLASDSPQEVVESLCREAMGVFDCDAFFNFLLDEKARRLRLNAYAGIPEEEARRLEWLDLGVAVCGCAARDGCRIVVEDILNTADPSTELVKSYGIQAYACHPLMVEGRVLGTLSFGTRTRPRYTPEELALMSAVADLVAIAMNRKLVEEALRESREDLNRAQAVAHTGSWRLNVQKNELTWSDENHRIFGILQGTPMSYETFLATVHPEDREYVDRKWNAALQGEPYDIEHRIVVDGAVTWVRERAELEFNPQGQLLGGFGTTQDITPLKRAEQDLKESESRHRSLFQDNHAVMLLIDPESGEIVDANPAACSFYEYTRKELTGMKITDLNIAPPEQVRGNMAKVKAGEESHFFFQHRLAHGEVREVEVYSSPLKVRGRTLLYSIIHDNTARKEAEETLRTSKDFLEIANRHMQMGPLLQEFALAVQEHSGCQSVAIRILDEEGNIPYHANTGFSKEFLESESNLCIKTDRCLCINVVKGATDPGLPCYTEGSSCYINNFSQVLAATPPGMMGETRNVCHHFGYESVALIPIVFREQILGLIHLADCRENMVPLSMVESLERIGLQLGTAINRVGAQEALGQALADSQQRQKEVEALLKATRAVLKSGDFQDIARSIFDSCKELVGATSGYVALLSEDGQENKVLFLDPGNLDCKVDPTLPMPVRGLREEAYRAGKTVYDNDFARSDHAQFLPRNHVDLKNVLFAPLVVKGKAVGLLGLGNKAGGFTENDARLAAGFGELAALALANKRAEEERERLIRELDTERGRLQAIIESAPEAIVVADQDGKILMTNPAAERLYSHPDGCIKDAPSCALFQFCHPDGTACIPGDQPLLRSAAEGEIHRDVEMVLAWPDGTRRDLLVNTAPIKDREGRSSGAVGLFQDITQRKRTEDKIRKLNADLSDRVREVSLRTLQLEAANKELEAFSYSVSHDLRTPLRAIEGFARMLVEDYAPKLDGEGLRLLDVIRSNTRIMGHLIDDLLALSRLGRQEIRAQEIDLEPMVAAVFKELQAQEPARRLKLKMKPLPPAFGDRNLLNQVLANLLGNAVKFTQPRKMGIIEVGGWTEGKENIYFIKDNGVGFDMRYVDKIFGVFQRLHRREEFEGTGVGLAIVQRIIHRHGGRVWASGKVGEGAEFYFALPVKGE